MNPTQMSDQEILAVYVRLAEVARQSLSLLHARDWQSLAVQQACEVELLARLQSIEAPLSRDPGIRESQAQLIHQILAAHSQAEILLQPWRDEVAVELQCMDSSRKLTRAYTAQPGGF